MDCIRFTVLALIPLVVSDPARADTDGAGDERNLWAVGVAGQIDEQSNDTALISLNVGWHGRTWLATSAGRSRSPEDRADVIADILSARIDHRFGMLGVTVDAERWGDPDALESSDFGASVYLQTERLRLGVRAEQRHIDIAYTITGPLGRALDRQASVEADGIELALGVRVADGWQLHTEAITYDYSRNVALLPRVQELNLLSSSTLTLANSLLDRRTTVGLEWEAGERVVSLGYSRDESAVDGGRHSSFDAAVLFPIARRIDIEFNVGQSRSDLLDSTLYGGVLLLIYGN
jgi:hypothetical protein